MITFAADASFIDTGYDCVCEKTKNKKLKWGIRIDFLRVGGVISVDAFFGRKTHFYHTYAVRILVQQQRNRGHTHDQCHHLYKTSYAKHCNTATNSYHIIIQELHQWSVKHVYRHCTRISAAWIRKRISFILFFASFFCAIFFFFAPSFRFRI